MCQADGFRSYFFTLKEKFYVRLGEMLASKAFAIVTLLEKAREFVCVTMWLYIFPEQAELYCYSRAELINEQSTVQHRSSNDVQMKLSWQLSFTLNCTPYIVVCSWSHQCNAGQSWVLHHVHTHLVQWFVSLSYWSDRKSKIVGRLTS